MALATCSAWQSGAITWPTGWGTSGRYKIISDREFVFGGKVYPAGRVSDPIDQNWCALGTISVALGVPTFSAFTLPQTDTGITVVNGSGEPRFTLVYYAASGGKKGQLFSDWRIGASLTTSFNFESLAIYNASISVINPRTDFLGTDAINNLITARLYTPSSTTQLGISKSSTTPTDSANPVHIEDTDPRVAQFNAGLYTPLVVTVPAPTSAPSLTATALGSGGFTGGVTYQVAYSYLVFDGTSSGAETGLSPATSFVAVTGQAIAVLPKASLANTSKWAVGAFVYISADGGVTFTRTTNWYGGSPTLASFADDTVFGGQIAAYNAGGASPQVAGTAATTKGGKTVNVPALAPAVTMLTSIPATTYYGAYCYVAGDGTDGALSAISSGVVVIAGKYVTFAIPQQPPSGAVAVKLYLGTVASAGSMHYQQTVPLHYVRTEIQTYDSSGAAPSVGAALSTLSGVQQAIDAAMTAGGGEVVVPVGPTSTTVPIIVPLKNGAGTQVVGMKIRGQGHDVNGSSALARIRYTGTVSGVVGVLFCGQSWTWSDLDFADPNSRVKYGLASCDFTGGGGFTSHWYRSAFLANAAGGIGYHVPIVGHSASSHITSEQYFESCTFSGNAWGIDIHGSQTGDIFFKNCTPQSAGNSNSANSGNVRYAADFNVIIDGVVTSGACGSRVFMTSDAPHPLAASGGLTVEKFFSDSANAAPFYMNISSNIASPFRLGITSNWFQGGDADTMALYSGTPVEVMLGNNAGRGNGWINFIATSGYDATYVPAITQVGPDSFFGVGATYSVVVKSPVITYTYPTLQTWVSALALSNAAGNSSTLSTNTAGELVQTPYYGIVETVGTYRTPSNSAATITANQNNYNPGNQSYYQRWDSDASRNVTGLVFTNAQLDGQRHLIVNIGLNDIVLKHQSASSTAANRFYSSTGIDITLTPKQAVKAVYDTTNQYWLIYRVGEPQAEQLVITVSGININTTTPQDVYTVPSGKTFIPTKVIFSDATGTGAFGAGASGSLRAYESTGGTQIGTISAASAIAVTSTVIVTVGALGSAIPAGGKVQVRPDIAYGAAETCTVRVFGILY